MTEREFEERVIEQLARIEQDLKHVRQCVESQARRLSALEAIRDSVLVKGIYTLGLLAAGLISFIVVKLGGGTK